MTLAQPEFAAMAVEQFDSLYRLARTLSHDSYRAEDLVQETYLRAWRARESFELKEYGMRPWLMRILHNLHYTGLNREARQASSIEFEVLDRVPGDSDPSPQSTELIADDLDERLLRALKRLPENHRAVLLLWAVEEKSYLEIAQMLELPIGTVMSRLHRARNRLAEELQPMLSAQRRRVDGAC